PQFLGDLRAEDRVIAAAPLGDIVQQHGEIKHAARIDGRKDAGCERQLVLEGAALDLMQHADREQRMLVDRVDMIHVVLYLRDDAAEIRNEAAEYPGLAHPSQRDLGILVRGQISTKSRL